MLFVGETSAKEDINIKETFEALLQKVHLTQKVYREQKLQAAMKLGRRNTYNDDS